MSTIQLEIGVVVSPLFDENCYIVRRSESTDCLVIDPGLDPESIQQWILDRRLQVRAILNTHGHADHIAGNEFLKRCWPDAPLVIGRGDADKLTDPQKNLSAPFGMGLISPEADQLVQGGDTFTAAGIELHVRDAPGHSVGHVMFRCDQCQPPVVFCGDVIFQGSIGRTDFPDGSFEDLARSIRNELYTLPDETRLYTGHGPATRVGDERHSNPFVHE